VIICLVVVLIGVVAFSYYAVSPAQGFIDAVKNSFGTQVAFDMRPQTITGAYASFHCPRGLTATPSQAVAGSTLEAFNWKHSDIQTWRLAVSIIDVPTYKITDNNAYLFRKLNPQRFKESLHLVNGHMVPIMTDMNASGFSKVGFLRYGRYQAIVSLYGDDPQGSQVLQATLAMVLNSWRWH